MLKLNYTDDILPTQYSLVGAMETIICIKQVSIYTTKERERGGGERLANLKIKQ